MKSLLDAGTMVGAMRVGTSRAVTATRKPQAPAKRVALRRLERLEAGYRDLRSELRRIRETLDAAIAQGELSLATVDPESLESVRRFEAGRLREARRRLRNEMNDLRAAGVIDATGRRVKSGVPPDMRESRDCDL